MNCDQVQPLRDAYLDSELDTRTTLEIEHHLKSCPACANRFAQEQQVAARLNAGLSQGPRDPALWQQIERAVRSAATTSNGSRPSARVWPFDRWQAACGMLGGQLRTWFPGSPRAWAALAVVWVAILVLNFSAREPDATVAARQGVPSASEIRLVLQQRQILLGDLAATAEPPSAAKAKAAPPSPRSDRQQQALNS